MLATYLGSFAGTTGRAELLALGVIGCRGKDALHQTTVSHSIMKRMTTSRDERMDRVLTFLPFAGAIGFSAGFGAPLLVSPPAASTGWGLGTGPDAA